MLIGAQKSDRPKMLSGKVGENRGRLWWEVLEGASKKMILGPMTRIGWPCEGVKKNGATWIVLDTPTQ